MSGSDNIAEALFECLLDCDDKSIKELADALKGWRDTYPRTYTSIRNRQPVANKLIQSMEEALSLRMEMHAP